MLFQPTLTLSWLALPALLINLILPATAWSKDFAVNSLENAADANPGDGLCQTAAGSPQCTLRAAVTETMASPGGVITLPAGVFALNGGDSGAPRGALVLDGDVVIEGAGAKATIIDAAALSRLVLVRERPASTAAPAVKLTNLSLRNGTTLATAAADDRNGGAIQHMAGQLSVSNVVLANNNAAQHGGAIHSTGTLEIINSTFDTNSAGNFGGALASDGPLSVQTSVFSNNQSLEGGALAIIAGATTLASSTFNNNNAIDQGGAIYVADGNVSATNITIVANVADANQGAGIDLAAGTMSLANSIAAFNSDPAGNPQNCDAFKNPVDAGHNLQYPATSCGSSIPVADPKLGAFGEHGGATQTVLPLSASPAIDAIDTDACPLTDQRGNTRVDGNADGTTACDIGAAEYVAPQTLKADLVVTVSDAVDPVFGANDVTYTLAAKNKGPAAATGVVMSHALPSRVTVVSQSSGCIASAGIVRCVVGELAVGAQKQYQVVVKSALQSAAAASRVPRLSVDDLQFMEDSTGATPAEFTVRLSPAATQAVTVDYATTEVTATIGNDFTATSGKLTFAAGETSKTVTVAVNADVVNEPDETFALELSNPSRALFQNSRALATIQNDDPARSLSLSPTSIDLGLHETGSLAVVLDGPAPAGGVTVSLAGSPANLATIPTTVIVPAGQNRTTIPLTGGNSAGSLVLTASATGFAGSQASINLKARALTLEFDRSPVGVGRTVTGTVRLSLPAPAAGVTVTLKSDKTTIATVPTNVSVVSGATNATFFLTGVAAGDAKVDATATGYIAASAAVKVTGNTFTLGSSSVVVGKNLQKGFTFALSAAPPAPALVDVVATIKDPSVALISNGTKVLGGTSALFPSINDTRTRNLFVQGLVEGKKTEIVLNATGYAPAIVSVEATPSGFIFNSSTLSVTSTAGPTSVNVYPVSLATGTLKAVEFQSLRYGPVIVEVAVKADSTLPGLFSATAAGLAGGDSSGLIQFDPNAVGVVKATLTQPAGFSVPDDARTLLTVKVCNVLPCP